MGLLTLTLTVDLQFAQYIPLPVVILRFAILTSSSDNADRGRSIIRVRQYVEDLTDICLEELA
jgi:hypothetical protein